MVQFFSFTVSNNFIYTPIILKMFKVKKQFLYGDTKKNSKCSWECLGKEPVWFHSPNVWVQSTHMVCNDCKKTASEITVNKMYTDLFWFAKTLLIFRLYQKECQSRYTIIPASTPGAHFDMRQNNAMLYLCNLFCKINFTPFLY